MAIRIVATLTLFAMLTMPGAATFDPARTFLMTAFNVTAPLVRLSTWVE